MQHHKEICESLLQKALEAAGEGAKAEIVLSEGSKKSLGILGSKPQSFDQAESRTISLTVLIGQKQASATAEDFSNAGLEALAEKTVEMARFTPENRDAFLAKPGEFITDATERAQALDLFDKTPHPDVQKLLNMATTLEKGALSVKGVTQCEMVQANFSTGCTTVLTSEGFFASIPTTMYVAYLSALAGKKAEQVNADDSTICRHFEDLPDLYKLGQKIGYDAVAKIGAHPIKSGQMPIIFDRDIAADFLDTFASSISGMNVDKGLTFLKDSMGEQIFPEGVTIVDDPTLPRGLGSDPCDSDGIASEPLNLVENGILKHWLLGIASAKRLKLKPNGRGDGITNLYMKPGTRTKEELIQTVDYGLYVTGTIGHGNDLTTGDFSRGAEGFLIEKGKLTKPVSEITIAGNLKDIFRTMTPANDLKMDDSTSAPTVRVDKMTVAGKA